MLYVTVSIYRLLWPRYIHRLDELSSSSSTIHRLSSPSFRWLLVPLGSRSVAHEKLMSARWVLPSFLWTYGHTNNSTTLYTTPSTNSTVQTLRHIHRNTLWVLLGKFTFKNPTTNLIQFHFLIPPIIKYFISFQLSFETMKRTNLQIFRDLFDVDSI